MVRRLSILLALLVVAFGTIFGRRITEEQATTYARNWWLQKDGPRLAVLEPVATEFPNIYLFVDTAGHGFVMLSADDRSLPVLGYSLSNDFSVDDMPAAAHDWVQGYNDQIQYLIDNNIEKTAEINAQWQDLNNPVSQLPQTWPSGKGPLLTTKWNQRNKVSPTAAAKYNNLCPTIGSARCLTGCVATAMAQIMKYHNFPTNGFGSNTYIPKGFTDSLTADFANTTYDWANMPNECTSYSTAVQDQAVALLMYHVGIAVNMDYGTGESAAKTVAANYNEPAAVNAYKKYFKYKWTARCVYKEDYTDEDWKLLLKAEIDAYRPMQYSASESGGGGHSFVCDGYDANEKFYINWGYSGSRDGFFEMGSLNYGSNYYNESNRAIIGIEPDTTAAGTITVTATSNNTAWGTVTGGGTYTKYSQTVTLTPVAQPGCKFVGWSNGSKEAPYSFLANGNGATLTANFAPVGGDTLYYCNNGYTKYYGSASEAQYAAIKIPCSSLVNGSVLEKIMFFATYDRSSLYEISIYRGSLTSTPCTTFTYRSYSTYKWVTVNLTNPHTIDASQDLYIVVKSPYYFAASMPAANADASWGRSENGSWTQMQSGGEYATWMIKGVLQSTANMHKITMNKSAVQLTSVTKDENLRTGNFAVSNKGAVVSFDTVYCDPPGCVKITDGYKLTATKVGMVRLKASAIDNQSNRADAYVDLAIGRGTLVVDQWDVLWSSASSWGPNYDVIPDSVNYDVMIRKSCIIDCDAQCHNMSIIYTPIVTIAKNAKLEVSGELSTSNEWNLLIKADATGSGTVIFGSGSPEATVEMYLKGTTDSDNRNPQWQLRGSIVDDFALEDVYDWANVRVYRWDEDSNSRGCWTNKMIGSSIVLQPWKGYGFANYSANPKTVTYYGTLLNNDQTWELTKTGSGNANVGNNMLTNSYSAPIHINKLRFDNAKSSVIFYNTGSWVDWNNYHGDTITNTGTLKGQMLVCPKWTAGPAGLPDKIPSGQSFYVVADSHLATVSVSYSDVAKSASGPMFAPSSDDQFNVLGVTISGSKGSDRAVLIECDECTDNYDDGYDGMKYSGSAALPQLFVVNAFGNTSINAAQTITGQKMGVYTSASGDTLTMKFETAKLSGYSRLKVKDLVNGHYVDVMAGEEYQFITTGNDAARFEILGSGLGDDHETVGQVSVVGNTIHAGDYEGVIAMYDMSGRLVWQTVVERNTSVELPELLHGVYVIKSDCSTIKIVK